jgi:hydroxymethylbilane synthase
MPSPQPVFLATRGSALALVQTNLVAARCRAAFPELTFEIKVIKTTGDKLQTAPPDAQSAGTKGLFTKELELALLDGGADLAVHSLKDLPTELPDGLILGAVLPRADVRDVLIYRGAGGASQAGALGHSFGPDATLADFPPGSVIGTGSTRRQAQALVRRPDLKFIPIRGNVGTRLQKLAGQPELDGLLLAAAGLRRLGFEIDPAGWLCWQSETHPQSSNTLRATLLPVEDMLPCVGQGAIGLEIRRNDPRLESICEGLNDEDTMHCVLAERAFLRAMGGGCLSPVAAYAEIKDGAIWLRAVSFRDGKAHRTEKCGAADEAELVGLRAGEELK